MTIRNKNKPSTSILITDVTKSCYKIFLCDIKSPLGQEQYLARIHENNHAQSAKGRRKAEVKLEKNSLCAYVSSDVLLEKQGLILMKIVPQLSPAP